MCVCVCVCVLEGRKVKKRDREKEMQHQESEQKHVHHKLNLLRLARLEMRSNWKNIKDFIHGNIRFARRRDCTLLLLILEKSPVVSTIDLGIVCDGHHHALGRIVENISKINLSKLKIKIRKVDLSNQIQFVTLRMILVGNSKLSVNTTG